MPLEVPEKSFSQQLLRRFMASTVVLKQIYEVTIYGQRHHEVRILQLLEKFGAKTETHLSRKELKKAIDEVNAIADLTNRSLGGKVITVNLNRQEFFFIRRALRMGFRAIRGIPALARRQLCVILAANFEGYVADAIRMVFSANHDTLKSRKSTLKDEELVDAFKSGNAIDTLIEHRVRNIMYGSANEWFLFLENDLGLNLPNTNDLVELFLVRNCVLHNNANVSRELQSMKKKRYRKVGKPLNVTERDTNRYITAAGKSASAICKEYERKFCS